MFWEVLLEIFYVLGSRPHYLILFLLIALIPISSSPLSLRAISIMALHHWEVYQPERIRMFVSALDSNTSHRTRQRDTAA